MTKVISMCPSCGGGGVLHDTRQTTAIVNLDTGEGVAVLSFTRVVELMGVIRGGHFTCPKCDHRFREVGWKLEILPTLAAKERS